MGKDSSKAASSLGLEVVRPRRAAKARGEVERTTHPRRTQHQNTWVLVRTHPAGLSSQGS